MEMSRLVAQFTADTTDTALPLIPIGKISLRTTYTTGKGRKQRNTYNDISGHASGLKLYSQGLHCLICRNRSISIYTFPEPSNCMITRVVLCTSQNNV